MGHYNPGKLVNKMTRSVLKEQMRESEEERTTISFYKYHQIEDPQSFRDELFESFAKIDVKGRIYVATEGINAQLSIPSSEFESFKTALYSYDWLDGNRLNIAVDDDGKSFFKLTIKVRNKVVADGLDDSSFDPSDTGEYLKVDEFNKLTDQEDTILIDMRNHYESEVGHFKGAILPDCDTFRDELPMVEEILEGKEEQNVVMYCTGGIRCEKATAYFKHKGFKNVYHLEGGIIKYAQDAKAQGLENKFIGKNFVFDERLGERISDDVIAECHQCGAPCDNHTNCENHACHLLFIQCDTCKAKYNNCCSAECKSFIELSPEEQKEQRKGLKLGRQVYKKGRLRPKLNDGEIKFSLRREDLQD